MNFGLGFALNVDRLWGYSKLGELRIHIAIHIFNYEYPYYFHSPESVRFVPNGRG
jgi:hypothetical protein